MGSGKSEGTLIQMPIYEISAPNGKTYEIEGPSGATDEQVRQKVLEQHPDAANPSLMDQAASFAKQHGRELATGLGAGLGGISGGALGAMAGGIGALPGGVAGAGLGAATGGQLFDVAEHYLGGTPTAPTGQRMAQLGKDVGFGATAEMGGQVAGHLIGAGIGAAAPVVAKALKYGTEAPSAAADVKAKAIALLLEKERAASAEAALAKSQSQSAGTTINRLTNEQAAAAAKSTPAPFSEGQITTLSERGQPVQTDIGKAKSDIIGAREAEYNILKQPIDEAVKTKEASGDYISNTPEAKALLKESKNVLNPSATKSPTATSLPTPEEAAVHKKVVDALDDRLVEVPESYAKSDAAKGNDIIAKEVTDFSTGERQTRYFRKFKSTYEAVDNLRRRFGDAFHGKDATGFEGVPEALIKDTYGKIRNIQKNYVGEDLYNPLQESYANYTKQLAPYNETQIGKSISGTQGSTEIPNLTASQIPGSVLSKGAGGFKQVEALGGNPTKLLADQLETAFHNPKTNAPRTSEEVRNLLHDTELGDAVSANPAIKTAVDRHLTQLQDAEMAGVRATEIGDTLKGLATKRETLAQTAAKQREVADALKIKAQSLDSIKEPGEVLNAAKAIIDSHSASPEVHADLTRQLQQAYRLNKEAGVRKFIKTWVARGALGAIGLSGGGAILHKAGSILGE